MDKKILIDFWGTLVESEKRENIWKSVMEQILNKGISKAKFFDFWKNNWFKTEINQNQFVGLLSKEFPLSKKIERYLEELINPNNLDFIKDRRDLITKLGKEGKEIYLVSDCGIDTKEFLEKSDINKYFRGKFYSFAYGTTKEEKLYEKVVNSLGTKLIMIGDNYLRDYKIPKRYGLESIHVDKNANIGERLNDHS
jgi:HAD superfamily hydrolase (TIGR01549 family)